MRALPFLLLVVLIGCDRRVDYPGVSASVETEPVISAGDAADDPAIWVNPFDAEASLILGTDKRRGLAVYDLQGKERQFIERGRLNNVDVRGGIALRDGKTALAAATNRTETSLDVFEVSTDGHVTFLFAQPLELEEPYGTCMMRTADGDAHVFVNDKNGAYQQWQLTESGQFAPRMVGEFAVSSQPEGCVVDDLTGMLYVGEEARGVWAMPADAARAGEMRLVDDVSEGHLVADVEGMGLYRDGAERTYLVVSSQGDDSFAVYHVEDDHRYVGSFRVRDHPQLAVDGTEETDGLAVTSVALGGAFPRGLLVVQDGDNTRPKANQNFKLIDWRGVAAVLAGR